MRWSGHYTLFAIAENGISRVMVDTWNEQRCVARGANDAFTVFVTWSPEPSSTYADGVPAVALLGGPYTNTPRQSAGWTTQQYAITLAHEMGHVYWACDEYGFVDPNHPEKSFYCGCGQCGTGENPPRVVYNVNCRTCNPQGPACVMDRAESGALCFHTKIVIGW